MKTEEKVKREDMPILNPKVVVVKRFMTNGLLSDADKDKDIIVGSDEYERKSNTYTILKNHNEDLVAKIKELAKTPFDGSVNIGFRGKGKIESEMGDQYICMGDNGERFFINKEELANIKKRQILNLINKTYPVGKYFNENFGYLFGLSLITVHSHPFEHEWNKGKEYQYDGLMASCYQEKSLWFHEYCGEIEVGEHSGGYRTMFCHFDEEGNYVNRDYNFNIVSNSKQETPTLSEALDHFSKLIPEGGYMRKDDRWYGESAAFCLDFKKEEEDKDDSNDNKALGFRFSKYEFKGKNTYVSLRYRSSKIKMPKTAVESSKEEIMNRIKHLLVEYGFQESYTL